MAVLMLLLYACCCTHHFLKLILQLCAIRICHCYLDV
jgi:hypothetical protein